MIYKHREYLFITVLLLMFFPLNALSATQSPVEKKGVQRITVLPLNALSAKQSSVEKESA